MLAVRVKYVCCGAIFLEFKTKKVKSNQQNKPAPLQKWNIKTSCSLLLNQ